MRMKKEKNLPGARASTLAGERYEPESAHHTVWTGGVSDPLNEPHGLEMYVLGCALVRGSTQAHFSYTPCSFFVPLPPPRLRRQWHVAARGYAMVKSDVFTAGPRTPPSSEDIGAGPPSPGHTDDETSDEEGGQSQLSSDEDKKETTMYDQLTACSGPDQEYVGGVIFRDREHADWSINVVMYSSFNEF